MQALCMKYKADISPCRPTVGAVIVCAGKGERTGLAYNKVLHVIGVKTVLQTVLDVFCGTVDMVTVVASEHDLSAISAIVSEYNGVNVVTGGATRFDSVYKGLKATPCNIAVIHDGARPYVTSDIISRSVASAALHGSGIAAVPCVDTVKRVDGSGKARSLPRSELFCAQTPQTFRYDEILSAYEHAAQCKTRAFTDDAEVYEHAGYSPVLIEGSYANKKITTHGDILSVSDSCRIGVGYDVHRLVPNRPLILGGVQIPFERGLLGHSDADVLTHAVMDALLSAAGLPDIGVLFPDTDDKYLGANSLSLLGDVAARVAKAGYTVGNISAVIIAQRPKLSPFIKDIRAALASALGISEEQVNVSATTTEGLGIVGSGDAVAANASCIITGERK